MCIDKIIEENRRFQEQIAWMKKHSPIYPQIQMKNTESEEIVAFTSIRKEHEGRTIILDVLIRKRPLIMFTWIL